MEKEINYKLEKLNFDGPLDLLLKLIEKDKIDIYDIPIADITKQYLEYMDAMELKDLDLMSDFLLMAATLLEIKARMLLPRDEEEGEEEEDPRDELVQRLILYRHFKYMASELEQMEDEASKHIYKEKEDVPPEVAGYIPPVDLDELLSGVDAGRLRAIFLEVMRRHEYRRDERRESFGVIRRERMPIGARISSLINFARKKRHFSFRSLLESKATKQEVVVTFLAVLELMKVGAMKADQQEPGGDMELSISGDIDESAINMEELVDE